MSVRRINMWNAPIDGVDTLDRYQFLVGLLPVTSPSAYGTIFSKVVLTKVVVS